MKRILSFLTVPVLFAIIALPTRSIQAYQPAQSLGIINPAAVSAQVSSANPVESQDSDGSIASLSSTCHFGISVISNWNDVDLSTLGVGNFLDWGRNRDTAVIKNVAENIDYYRVLNLFDKNYAALKLELPGLVAKGYGAAWIIGNEPDSEVTYQNHISAETYGQRYFELANIIRQNDPTAKIGFGAIMQVTPIRLYYLDLALNQLAQLAGGVAQAHALIDFYAIHAYILNETQLYDPATGKDVGWGTGVPVGYDPSTWPAPEAIHTEWGETYKLYDIDIFKARLIEFRQWMVDHGQGQALMGY